MRVLQGGCESLTSCLEHLPYQYRACVQITKQTWNNSKRTLYYSKVVCIFLLPNVNTFFATEIHSPVFCARNLILWIALPQEPLLDQNIPQFFRSSLPKNGLVNGLEIYEDVAPWVFCNTADILTLGITFPCTFPRTFPCTFSWCEGLGSLLLPPPIL